MPAYLLVHVLIRTVILVVLCTLAIRSGYRIGYRDYMLGRRPRIPLLERDDDPGDTAADRTSADPLSCILEGTVTGLKVHNMLDSKKAMALFTLVDGSRSTVCVVFPKVLADCGGVLAEGASVRVSGTLESSIDFIQLAVTAIEPLT